MPNLEKVAGERNLYRNPTSGSYFLRVTNPKDNFISLGTKLKTEAVKEWGKVMLRRISLFLPQF